MTIWATSEPVSEIFSVSWGFFQAFWGQESPLWLLSDPSVANLSSHVKIKLRSQLLYTDLITWACMLISPHCDTLHCYTGFSFLGLLNAMLYA